ncbi:hypothetical protein GJ744_001944 [Endocarpon pusillum]|uniref:Carrier domain-containing protein n=1 Tax=Endocarpon pusillum TaxID=364733 RepID=A0A8H7ASS8_9EURO|nr:hypothetical protein GJ744_001944 [Endocarpon pusillum]
MVPSIWLIAETFPLTASKKVDRITISRWVQELDSQTYSDARHVDGQDYSEGNATPREKHLQTIIARVLGLAIGQVWLTKSFLNLGGDSILAMQLITQCRREGLKFTVKDVMRSQTISALALTIQEFSGASLSKVETFDMPFELSPIQQMYFNEITKGSADRAENQFNQSFLLRLNKAVRPEALQEAINKVVQHHSMLRARFRKNVANQWTQLVLATTEDTYSFRVHKVESREEALSTAEKSQQLLDIENGPVFAADLFDIATQGQLLFLVAHHLVIDLVSWRVILRQLEESLQLGSSLETTTPLPFQTWTKLQAQYASSNLNPSTALPYHVPAADYGFWGMQDTPNLRKDTEEVFFALSGQDTTFLLKGCHESLKTEPLDLFLSVLFQSFADTFGRPPPAIFNEGHGREPWDSQIDVSETVGWFTTMFPLHTPVQPGSDFLEIVRQTKDQRRQLPRNGWAYFASRFLHEEGRKTFGTHYPIEILFNYLGILDGSERADNLLRIEPFNKGDVGPAVRRFALFEINVYVNSGAAHFSFTFNREMRHQNLIRQWVENYRALILEAGIILQKATPTLTLSDFPLLPITFPALQKFQSEILPELGLCKDDLEDVYACSPMQEGILLSQTRLTGTYQVRIIVEVVSSTGKKIDIEGLQAAWQRLVDRHASLRTVFVPQLTTRPFDQLVLKNFTPESSVLCLESKSVLDELNKLQVPNYKNAEPPHRFTLVETKDGKVFCKLEINHALIDGTSMAILISELALAYQHELPETPGLLYSDYIAHLKSHPPGKALQFWKEHLSGVKSCQFPLLIDNQTQADRYLRSISVTVPNISQVRTFCRQHNVTLANVFRLAWAVVLRAYTGNDQVCFGYLASGREIPVVGIESAVGAFINMLTCSLDFSHIDKKSIGDALDDLQDEYLKVLPWQHTSLAEIQHELGLSGQTLFNTVLSFQRRPMDNFGAGDIIFRYMAGEDQTEYDISINVADSDEGIHVVMSYLTSRLSEGQAANVSGCLSTALSSILEARETNIGALDLFGDYDARQVWAWNKTCPPLVNECLHTMLQNNARKNPGAPAIDSWDGAFSYTGLDKKTTQLAHYLVKLGVEPDVLVPICFEKSSWAIIAMFAILKAGGGFVPLDPAHPPERHKTIISQTGSTLALVSNQMVDRLTSLVEKVVVVSPSSEVFEKESEDDVRSSVKPSHAAYTLFTSGSTGTPKGVLLDHSAVSSSIIHHGAEIGCSHSTRMFQFAAYTFDACVLEIFATIAYGGCICVPSDTERMSDISGSMTRMQVNTSFLTPSVVRIITPEQVPSLKTLILGGEALGQDNIEVWADKLRLMNGYGPTETCVFCVMKTFGGKKDRNDILGNAVSSLSWIVRPDNYNQLAPVGSIGMLLVQGPTLARGYLHDAAKTAGVFIDDLEFLRKVTGAPQRLYVTGDLARYNSDGTITYLGRRDTQVKLRGQRIELAEIEHQVRSQFLVASQIGVEVVVPHGDKEKATLAVFFSLLDGLEGEDSCFITLSDALKIKLLGLQKALNSVLPPYMVPSLYIHVSHMPTTTAGKLNRQHLRDAAAQLSDAELIAYSLLEGDKHAPETVAEKKMAELWHAVLKIPVSHIGAGDNFFRIGGDSIMAMRLAAASTVEISLTVADIFRYPTLSEMALVASKSDIPREEIRIAQFELLQSGTDVNCVRKELADKCGIEEHGVEDAYPCTPLQEGLMALSILRPGAYMTQKVFKLPASMDLERFKNAWESCVEMHPILKTRVVQTDSAGALQVVTKDIFKWRTAVTLQDYLTLDKAEAVAYGKPLSRFAVTKDRHFVWTAHHAIYDGWSIPLVLEQVKHAYEHGKGFTTPAFNRFISYLGNTDREASRSYWKEQFTGTRASSFPELPSPSHQLNVSEESHHSISISRKPGSSILMATILRAAWAFVQGKYADSQDVNFGVTLSGRNAPVLGIDKMLGPTITTVPVRIQMPEGQTVSEFLQQVQRQATEMMPHEQFGLQNIGRLSPEASRAVQFQNLFVVQPLTQFDIHGNELLDAMEVSVSMDNFDTYPLVFECSLSNDKVNVETRYDGTLISKHQMQRILYHFEHVVRLLNDESENTTITELDMFTEEDQTQILEWNRRYPEVVNTCVPEVFAQQVQMRPQAPAVNAWDGDLTYAELGELSTKLAHHLVANGVGPEVLVPLCFEKSCWAVVAQMSVMKAGGACINLDPAHPLSRLELIIQDVRAQVMLVAPQYINKFGTNGPKVIAVAEKFIRSLPSPSSTKLPEICPTDTAYVLFTSGSTGKPKGIVIEHGSLCTSSSAHGSRWNINSHTRLLQFAAYTFDVSCADIFTTLQRGGCICVPSEHDRVNDLAGAINKFQCNWAFLTPTVASLLPTDGIPTLKTLVLGGEASTRDTIQKWHDVLDLIICYGPAECSVYCSGASPATKTSDPADLGSAIGALYWVADPLDHNRLVPVGCVGELLLEGRTVARGYLHDEEKTANAFIANPPWAAGGSSEKPRRFYKTGDLVRYNDDGTIHFVGRKDTQVKVRGQRVELGEIEHAIRVALPRIAHVTVDAVRLQSAGDRQAVVAFLYTTTDSGPAEALPLDDKLRKQMISLQRDLSELLPSYMIPSMFVPMSQVPLTMNGKADRRQLRDMASSLPREKALIYSLEDAVKQEPTTEMEFKLRTLWGRVMGIDEHTIGVGDHFFRLGGDSILAMKLVGAAAEQGIVLSVKDLFTKPVLADMAAYASSRTHLLPNGTPEYQPFSLVEGESQENLVSGISSQIGVSPNEVADILPATDFQQNAFAHALLRTRGLLNYLFLDGADGVSLDLNLAKKSCMRLVQEHEILRTVFAYHKEEFVQVVLEDAKVDFEVFEVEQDIGAFSTVLCKKDAATPLRPGQSLVKFMVVKAKKSTAHRIIMRVSHAQYDGVCLPRIWQSLEDAFTGRAIAIPPAPFRKYMAAASRLPSRESQQYWTNLLKGSNMTNIVTHCKPSYRNVYNLVSKRSIPNISLASTGVTFATVLKTAWAMVLGSLSNSNDVIFGHVISGRNMDTHGVAQIVGPCLNIIPIRVKVAAPQTTISLVKEVQDQHIASMAYENLGFRSIIRNCTAWPKWTRLSSIVQHQNIDEVSDLQLAGADYSIGHYAPEADEADLAIKSTPMADRIDIVMLSSKTGVGANMSAHLLDLLCETIVRIPEALDRPATSLLSMDPHSKQDRVPLLPLQPVTSGAGHSPRLSPASTINTPLSPVAAELWDQLTLRNDMIQTWRLVLGDPDLDLYGDSDFFELGGDLVSVAVLAAMLWDRGHKVAVEQLTDSSSLADMVALLATS